MKPFVATFKIRQKVGDWFKMKNEDALCIKDDVHTHLDVCYSLFCYCSHSVHYRKLPLIVTVTVGPI